MIKYLCDRCGEDIFLNATIRAQVVKGRDGTLIWEMCERCAIELESWVQEKIDARS